MFQEQYFFIDCTEMESRVHRFISSRSDSTEGHRVQFSEMRGGYQGDGLSCEQRAVEAGIYKARYGTVSLLSAKSVLNRYAMAQPMDPIVRSSRGALTAHLPLYKGSSILPPIYQHFSFGESGVLSFRVK
jgi:hypothetical protein